MQQEATRALIKAAKSDDTHELRAAVRDGADINAAGGAVIYSAIFNGQHDIANFMLQAGADIDIGFGQLIYRAAEQGSALAVRFLIKAGANVRLDESRAICIAADRGFAEIVEMLHKAGADVDARSGEPIRRAASNGRGSTVRYLIAAGADTSKLALPKFEAALSLKFLSCLRFEVAKRLNLAHPATRALRIWRARRSLFEEVRLALADQYYRPGDLGYAIATMPE